MSELKNQKIVEIETLKRCAEEVTDVLLTENALFNPSLVNTQELSFQVQVLDLIKSNLRRKQRNVRNEKNCTTVRQTKQRIDKNLEQIEQYKKVLSKQYQEQLKVQKSYVENNATSVNVVDEEIVQQICIDEQHFQSKYTNRLERLQQIKIEYNQLLVKVKRNYQLLKKVIEINCKKNNTFILLNVLNQLLEVENNLVLLLKKIYHMENIIYLEKKEQKKSSSEDIFVSKESLSIEEDRDIEENNSVDSLYINNYIDKLKKFNDLDEVLALLNHYPELYELKGSKNRYIFEDILTEYFNILINRDINLVDVKEKMEYLNRLIAMHSNFGAKTGNEFYNIIQSKINHVMDIVEKNNYRNEKKQEILRDVSRISNQLHYYQQLNMPKKPKKKHEIQKETQIITIDNQQAKVFEDALSIYKTSSTYYLTLYVTDVASFVKSGSVEDRGAREDFMNASSAIFSKDLYQRFSLTQGLRRYAYAYTFALTENMEVREFTVKKVKIRVSQNFNFRQVSIAYNDRKSKYYETLHLLTEVSEKLNRESNLNICKNKNLTSGALVEIPVQFAKNFIAEYCIENQLPMIMQHNDCNVSDGISKSQDGKVYSLLERGISLHLEFTSPARSYIALLNQRLHNLYFISEGVNEDEMSFLVSTIKEVCNGMNQDKYGYQKVLK